MSLDDVQLHLVDDFETACELMRWLSSEDAADSIAVDTETTGLVIGKDRIRLAQLGGMTHGWAVPWDQWNGLYVEALKRYEGRIDMHNAKFDAGMLATDPLNAYFVPRSRIDDTRVMSHILEPNMSTALKSQAARHVDSLAAGAQGELHKAIGPRGAWDWATVPIDFGPYWQYAALDTVLTRHLKEHHAPLTRAIGATESYQLEMAAQWVIEKAERYGAHVDVPYAREHYDKFLAYVATAEKWVLENYGVKPGSNAAIVRILQDAGYEFTKATASGAVALDKEVLDGIDHPLAQTVLQRRQLQKLAATYLKHFIEEVDADDCIHPSINTLGARTSRMSMERPNLQNLPRKSEKNRAAEVVRNSISAREGNTLLLCDFDQIEMRLLAHLSRDEGLRAAFLGPDDFFVSIAREVFHDPTLVKKDPRRSLIKNTTYAEVYGAGLAKQAATARVPVDDVKAVKSRFDTLYPGVKSFKKSVEMLAWRRQRDEGVGYVLSGLGTGRRHIADHNKMYALVNWLIQGTAAEALKYKIVELDAAGLGDYFVAPVHDEVILDVPNDMVPDAVETLKQVMNDDKMFSVPITASVSYGERWGAKVDWDK